MYCTKNESTQINSRYHGKYIDIEESSVNGKHFNSVKRKELREIKCTTVIYSINSLLFRHVLVTDLKLLKSNMDLYSCEKICNVSFRNWYILVYPKISHLLLILPVLSQIIPFSYKPLIYKKKKSHSPLCIIKENGKFCEIHI